MSGADARNRSAFGAALEAQLNENGKSQTELASATGRSVSYVNQTMTGRKPVSPSWADLVADVLNLPEKDRVQLHRAAATDAGFRLDLTRPKRTAR